MNNLLHVELVQLRQRELQAQAETRRQHAVTSQNSLSNTLNTLFTALAERTKRSSTADEAAHLAWLADQA